MENEHWKDEVMGSLEGASRAEPGPLLYESIRGRLNHVRQAGSMTLVRGPYLALAAACLVLLFSANVWALTRSDAAASPGASSIYALEQANFDLY